MAFGELLRRGIAAGAAAGLAAAAVLYLLVEPVIRKALVIEQAREAGHAAAHGDEEPLVSRTMQVIGGMGTAVVVGVLFGIVFAVVFARTRHRLPGSGDYGRALALAGIGFVACTLLPALKIPSNPPAVGDPDTVTRRTLVYVLTILVSVAIVLAVFALDRALADRGLTDPARTSLDLLAFVAAAAVMLALLPGTPDSIPDDVPAALIWEFRLASLAQLAAMWATLGVVFGLLVAPRVGSERTSQRAAA